MSNLTLLGQRFLFKVKNSGNPFQSIGEGLIDEISPSKKYVHIIGQHDDGESWFKWDDVDIIEWLALKEKCQMSHR